MKMLSKSIAVAVMAMAATGAAEARIQNIGEQYADGSELLLNVWNATAQNSFTLDLGITIAQFLANPSQPITINLSGSNFSSFTQAYAAGNNVTWGVSGGYGLLNQESDLPKAGFFTTSVSAAPASIDPDWAQISNTMGAWDNMVGSINTTDANAANQSTFRGLGAGLDPQGYTGLYGNDFLATLPFVAQGNLGDALYFVREKVNADDFDTGELEVFAGMWNLNLAGAQLTYSAAPVSAVPLPAAVWMFGAGLMGVLRLNRRKSIAA